MRVHSHKVFPIQVVNSFTWKTPKHPVIGRWTCLKQLEILHFIISERCLSYRDNIMENALVDPEWNDQSCKKSLLCDMSPLKDGDMHSLPSMGDPLQWYEVEMESHLSMPPDNRRCRPTLLSIPHFQDCTWISDISEILKKKHCTL